MKNRILIVDDSESWLMFHKTLIEELYGDLFELTLARSAEEAYNIVRQNINNPFNLIITDMQMEMMYETEAGEWLIQRVKELSKYYACKIVIISGMYNIQAIADKYNVDCISKNILIHNKLLLKFLFEKLMPFLTKI